MGHLNVATLKGVVQKVFSPLRDVGNEKFDPVLREGAHQCMNP